MKLLIVAPQPYRGTNQSRSQASYFGTFSQSELAQIFSDARPPIKGLCGRFFQISDGELLRRRIFKPRDTIFWRDDLSESDVDAVNCTRLPKPRRKTGFYRFLRRWVWKKKYWDTAALERFVADFEPDAVFVAWSEDFFVFDVAMHFAKEKSLPLITAIMDDTYFLGSHRRRDVFYGRYIRQYRKKIDEFMSLNPLCFFVSDKIKDRYVSHFGVSGETIHIGTSNAIRRMEKANPIGNGIYYFGNLEYGRLTAIDLFARSLRKADPSIPVHVYSKDVATLRRRVKNALSPNVFLHNQIAYDEIHAKAESAGALLVAESFEEDQVEIVKYSLTTKTADYLSYGVPIIAVGGRETGCMDFFLANRVAYCCYDLWQMDDFAREIAFEPLFDKGLADRMFDVATRQFDESVSAARCKRSCEEFVLGDKRRR